MAVAMTMAPVMGPGGDAPKTLRPSLDAKLAEAWRYAGPARGFVAADGRAFSPGAALPKGTVIRPMAPDLARADRATLSADEANLARSIQIVFPKGTPVESYLDVIRTWPCVETVQRPPEVSLP